MGEPVPVVCALRDRRMKLTLSRADVAARLHVSTVTVRAWEVGERRMSLVQAYAYGAGLGVRPALRAGVREPVPLGACPDVPNDRVPPVLTQLRATRLARELSHSAIAVLLGTAPSTPVYWETGARTISLARAHGYATALDVLLTVEEISPSVSALVEAGGCPSPASTVSGR